MRARCMLPCLLLLVAALPADEPDLLAGLRLGHPRLLATPEDFARLRQPEIDPLKAAIRERLLVAAEAILTEPVLERIMRPGPRPAMLEECRHAIRKVLFSATAYRLNGDRRFLDRAVREMRAIAALADWNPNHFLDTAELSTAMALGYDWLHDALTPEDQRLFKAALRKHALSWVPQAYGPADKDGRDQCLWWLDVHHNWNQVCNTGLLLAALALADEEPELARLTLSGVRASLPAAMNAYAPDGAYPEGPGYWEYGTSYNVIALAALESALGTDLGLAAFAPDFAKTANFRLQMQTPTGLTFNYADASANAGANPSPVYGWLAGRHGPATAVTHLRGLLERQFTRQPPAREQDRFAPLQLFWLPAAPDNAPAIPLHAHFRGPADIAVFRSAWDDPSALFVGFKAGSNDVNHSHLDLGSFVLEADGVRWSVDLGGDNYALPGYFEFQGPRWQYYRLINQSHSTLTPGDRRQDPQAHAPLLAFDPWPAHGYATADLTAAYPGAAKRILRTISMRDRARVLVQDDVIGLAPGLPLHWRMMTEAAITLSKDGRTATLAQNGKELRAELLSPETARFTIEPARPPTAVERQNEPNRILQATVPVDNAVARVRLAVLLSPVGAAWPALPTPKPGPPPVALGQEAKRFESTHSRNLGYDYLLFRPTNHEIEPGKRWPLIIFLHGAGERGRDLNLLARMGPPKFIADRPDFPFIVVSPQCPAGQHWDPEAIIALLDDVTERYAVDPGRVYLTGPSMGGFGTWNTAVRHPERFAAIVPICGGGDILPTLLNRGPERTALQSLGVWAFHGALDDVVALAESERMVVAFKKAGASDVQLTVYPETRHDSWTATYANPALYEWLLSHRRPTPE